MLKPLTQFLLDAQEETLRGASEVSKEILDACKEGGERWRANAVEQDARNYVRTRDLHKKIAINPAEIEDESIEGTEYIIGRLQEVSANLFECWRLGKPYDTNRHIGVLGALKAEREKLEGMKE